MPTAAHRDIVAKLNTVVDAAVRGADEYGPTEEQTAAVVDAVRVVLEDGLEGNRSTRPFIWSLVRRVGKAYPVTFHPSIDKVRALGRQDTFDREQLEDAWIKQALHEGVLSFFLTNIIRQFQIRSAYLSEAVICNKQSRLEIISIVDRLKDFVQPVPYAPSVSSWSSDDSFVYTPRSVDIENKDDSTTGKFSGFSSHDGSDDSLAFKSSKGDDIQVPLPQVSADGIKIQDGQTEGGARKISHRSTKRTQVRKLNLVQERAAGGVADQTSADPEYDKVAEDKRMSSDECLELRTPDRPSLFGRITRSLSGTLYHTIVNDQARRDGPTSELSQEERKSRFWSRQRSGSGSLSLFHEVEKDLGSGVATPVTAEERSKAAQMLVREICKVARLVLQQYCSNGLPLSMDLYPLSKMLILYEEAFAIGLRPCPLFRPTVPDMYLSDFEKILPSGNATPYTLLLGLQKIYPYKQFGIMMTKDDENVDDSSLFQKWLKSCLTDKCLEGRMESVLNNQEFLQGWYFPEAIVTNEDLVQAVIATCRELDLISVEQDSCQNASATSECNVNAANPDEKERIKGEMSEMETQGLASVPVSSEDNINIPALHHEAPGRKTSEPGLKDALAPAQGTETALETPPQTHAIEDIDPTPPFSPVHSGTECASEMCSGDGTQHASQPASPDTHQSPSASDVHKGFALKQELPSHQQISLATSRTDKLRLGDSSRTSSRIHHRSASIISSCLSGEDEDDWRGVWKDVDVVRHEVRSTTDGEHFVIYVIEVVAADGTHWQTARRFSDLVSVNRALLKQDVELPHSWTNLSKARVVTGRKRFSQDIIEARMAMLRQCLWDLMTLYPESLIWTAVSEFLDAPLSLLRATKSRQRSGSCPDDRAKDIIAERIAKQSSGMPLIVDLPVNISDEVLFEMQKGLCAGCQAYLPFLCSQKSLFQHSISPRKCEYTELLHCHKCHKLDTAYLPSRVLHCWDFTKYSVSISSKTYLYSMFPSPVLCINAVNPGLLASVPILGQLEYLRQGIVRNMDRLKAAGPEGKRVALSIEESAGDNKHLLRNADFWSLKDLGDISRGVFARLPRWLEVVSKQISSVVESHGNI